MSKDSWIHQAFHGQTALRTRMEGFVYVLISCSVLLLVLEMSLGRDHALVSALRPVDDYLLGVFAVEIALRVLSYHPPSIDFFDLKGKRYLTAHIVGRLRYCLSPWLLLDLFTVLAFVPELRSLRALRLMRLLRGFQLFRYSNPFHRLARALAENRLQFYVGIFLICLSTVIGGLTVYSLEYDQNSKMNSVGDGLWWALVTLTTVGFGDVVPVTGAGRFVGGILMLIGMLNLGLFAAIVGHTLPKALMRVREEQFRMSGYLNHWVVCGYESGSELFLKSLAKEMNPDAVVLLFGPSERPDGVPGNFVWVEGDPQKESELSKLRLEYAAGVILVAPRSLSPQQADATTILTAFTIRSYLEAHPQQSRKKPLFIVAEVLDGENRAHLITAGVDEVVETNRVGFSLLSHATRNPGTARVIGQMASFESYSMYVGMAELSSESETFAEVSKALKSKHRALLVGVRRANGEELINPDDDLIVQASDTLIYVANRPVLASSI